MSNQGFQKTYSPIRFKTEACYFYAHNVKRYKRYGSAGKIKTFEIVELEK